MGLKKITKLLALLVVLMTCLALSGCGKDYKSTITVYNWGDYIDKSVIQDFEKEYNIRVIYEEFSTNEDMYVKLKAGGGDYDVIFPSDYMIKRLIDEDMLHKIDLNNVPNYKNIEDRFKNLGYDPNNEYSVPYMWGTVGIIYNKTMVDEPIDSWKALWNEKYKKQILMMYSQRDSIGITLKMLGYSLNTKDKQQLEEAKEMLIKQKPLVLAYVVDEVKDKMIGGEAAMAVVWSGDALYMTEENPDLEYVIPKEGSNLWFDGMAIPKVSKHKEEAELFIDFLCRPENAFKNTDYIGYSTPNSEAKKMLPEEIKSNRLYYPLPEDVENCEVFVDLADALPEYDRIWTEIHTEE